MGPTHTRCDGASARRCADGRSARLIGAAATLGLSARALRVDIDELRQVACPAILHWDFDHFVVLKRVARRYVEIHNPAVGERRFPLAELSKHFTGVALELTPTAAFERAPRAPRLTLWSLWHGAESVASPHRAVVGTVGFRAVVRARDAIVHAARRRRRAGEARTSTCCRFSRSALPLLAVLNVATKTLRGFAGLYLANRLNFSFGARLFFHLIRLPLEYFQRRHVGDVISRFRSLKPVQEFITGGVVAAVIDGAMALTTLDRHFRVFAAARRHCARRVRFLRRTAHRAAAPAARRSHESIAADARLDSHFLETIRALQGVKLFGKEAERERAWQDLFVDSINAGVRVTRLNLGYDALSGLLLGIEGVLIVFVGAQQVLSGALTIGMLYAFIAYRTHFSNAMNSLITQIVQGLMLTLHLERISDIAFAEQEPGLVAQSSFTAPVRGALRAERLSFTYPGDELAAASRPRRERRRRRTTRSGRPLRRRASRRCCGCWSV